MPSHENCDHAKDQLQSGDTNIMSYIKKKKNPPTFEMKMAINS